VDGIAIIDLAILSIRARRRWRASVSASCARLPRR
jgi:hypothetical protein